MVDMQQFENIKQKHGQYAWASNYRFSVRRVLGVSLLAGWEDARRTAWSR